MRVCVCGVSLFSTMYVLGIDLRLLGFTDKHWFFWAISLTSIWLLQKEDNKIEVQGKYTWANIFMLYLCSKIYYLNLFQKRIWHLHK